MTFLYPQVKMHVEIIGLVMEQNEGWRRWCDVRVRRVECGERKNEENPGVPGPMRGRVIGLHLRSICSALAKTVALQGGWLFGSTRKNFISSNRLKLLCKPAIGASPTVRAA